MKKVLAIGNSFSQDATAMLELLTDELYVRNLFIGGCSLETHCRHVHDEDDAYVYQENGASAHEGPVSLKWGLLAEDWDEITIQQNSGLSGMRESYDGFTEELIAYVRAHSRARISFHRTWAYEKHSEHRDFPRYDCEQDKMWNAIRAATDEVCAIHHLPIIETGDLMARLRTEAFFDVDRGGVSLCRDGYHLSMSYGRLAAAASWVKYFTGKTPAFLEREGLSLGFALIKKHL